MPSTENTQLIEGSLYFDSNWYLLQYPFVEALEMAPSHHYLKFGSRLGLDPGPNFSTFGYLRRNRDVQSSDQNPLIHFEISGKTEGRSWRIVPSKLPMLREFKTAKATMSAREIDSVTIIVPIYNGLEHVQRLLPRLLENTSAAAEILLIDDASPDQRVAKYINQFRHFSNVRIYTNEKNLGFLKTVNEAAQLARRDFCLLNSDADVPSNWLERLMLPIFSDRLVASTTPFTNSATIFSFPVWLQDNDESLLPPVDLLDSIFEKVAPSFFLDRYCPTGVGFCMGINGDIWRQIGGFDEVAFGKGYAEENDWCQRAIKNGYRNEIVPNLYVAHYHGGSFSSDEKQRLVDENLATLLRRWPNYNQDIQNFISLNPWKSLRETVFLSAFIKTSVVVFFDHGLGGGTSSYFIAQKDQLTSDGCSVTRIYFDRELESYQIELWAYGTCTSFYCSSLDELEEFLLKIERLEIKLNNLVSWPEPLEALALIRRIVKLKNCYLAFLLHDYYAICSSYTLLNNSDQFCGVPQNSRICVDCIKQNKNALHPIDVDAWRTSWNDTLDLCAAIDIFCPSSVDIFVRAFPSQEAKIQLKPHELLSPLRQANLGQYEKLTIGVVGNLSFSKGADVVRQLVQYIEEASMDVQVVLIGTMDPQFQVQSTHLTEIGTYDRSQLPEILETYEISVTLVPSIWPETFSYVTQELIVMNVPIVCFDNGGQADQVKEYSQGILADSFHPAAIIDACNRVVQINGYQNTKLKSYGVDK